MEYVIELNIPGRGLLRLQHLVTDVNGTLAIAGQLQEGAVAETLLSADLVMPTMTAALELLDKPLRIVASLRK